MSKKTPTPTLRRRVLASGREQFYGYFAGRQMAFGTDLQEARREFAETLRSWEAHGQRLPDELNGALALTIADLVRSYVEHADEYYRRPDGTATNEARNVRDALGGDATDDDEPSPGSLLDLYGDELAENFGPVKLAHVRDRMIEAGLARGTINSRVHRVRRAFRWAASRELIPGSVVQSLSALEGLRRGRSAARETDPIRPVALEDVEATVPHLSRQVAAMVWLQWWSGMRPGEVVAMRPCDVDTIGEVWIYSPAQHKTEHHGREREIDFGPRAQGVLQPFLQRVPRPPADRPLFQPSEAEAERSRSRRERRRTPMTPSQARRRGKVDRARAPGESYDVTAYRNAIRHAVKQANAARIRQRVSDVLGRDANAADREVLDSVARTRADRIESRLARAMEFLSPSVQDALRGVSLVPKWFSNQLRHSAGTRLRKEVGLEAARVVLGHARAAVTEIYAEVDHEAAREIMKRLG